MSGMMLRLMACDDERILLISLITVLNGNLSISLHISVPLLSPLVITRQPLLTELSQHYHTHLSSFLSLMRQGNLLFNYYTQTTTALKLWPVKLQTTHTFKQFNYSQYCIQKKVQKLLLGWCPFTRYTFEPEGCILVPQRYILVASVYISVTKCYILG